MKHVMRMALMIGVAVGALWAVSGDRGYTQAADPNAASVVAPRQCGCMN